MNHAPVDFSCGRVTSYLLRSREPGCLEMDFSGISEPYSEPGCPFFRHLQGWARREFFTAPARPKGWFMKPIMG